MKTTRILAALAAIAGDHVYVLTRPEDRGFIHLLFGDSEEA